MWWGEKPKKFEDEKQNEIYVLNFLNKNTKNLVVKRYECYDRNGEETYQIIKTKYGNKRCPDLYVENDDWVVEVTMRVEVKHMEGLWNGALFLIEKKKFDDYFNVQSSEEIEGRIIFLIGIQSTVVGIKTFWQTLDKLNLSKVEQYIPAYDGDCYVWDEWDMNVYFDADDFFNR
jgi:hypothetical protein